MIIDCVSDLHGYQPTLAGGDLLIVAGDLTARDSEKNWVDFEHWICNQKYKEKIIIAGNHDNFLSSMDSHCMARYWDKVGVTYLCDSGTEFNGLRIWGSPWSLWFQGINSACAAFTGNEEHLRASYALIPQETDILITHTPPKNILDGIPRFECVDGFKVTEFLGSASLYDRLCDIRPRLHVFGHIHEQGGRKLEMKRSGYGTENNTTCVNASIMNEHYQPTNKPMRFIL